MIRQHSAYVNAFSDSFDMDTFNSVRTFDSYSQVSWIVHFLQNLLSRSVVILKSLSIGTS